GRGVGCGLHREADARRASERAGGAVGGRRSRRCGPQRVPPLRLRASAVPLARRHDGGLLIVRPSATFDAATIAEIHRAAREGMYAIRGFGAKRRVPHFDDLLFLGASVSRYPLEGYREA